MVSGASQEVKEDILGVPVDQSGVRRTLEDPRESRVMSKVTHRINSNN